jgi:hypothetical protein
MKSATQPASVDSMKHYEPATPASELLHYYPVEETQKSPIVFFFSETAPKTFLAKNSQGTFFLQKSQETQRASF